jgi:hypothetical protein
LAAVVEALRLRAAAATDLVAQGLLDPEAALTLVVWPTDKVLISEPGVRRSGGPESRTEEQRLRALALVDAGWSWAAAVREVGVPKTTVGTWIRKRSVARVGDDSETTPGPHRQRI